MTEQEHILTYLLDCRRVDLYTEPKTLTPEQSERLSRIEERRKRGEPLQYILGFSEFLGFKLLVDKRVLIPRPETELLVDMIVDTARRWNKPSLRILDIGTGSGNIAISLAGMIEQCEVTSIDISPAALEVARNNARLNGVDHRIHFLGSDLLNIFSKPARNEELFDIIVSNPPYIPTAALDRLPVDVRQEPRVALDGGNDGLDFYRRIAASASGFLKEDGILFLEIGEDQFPGIQQIFGETGAFKSVQCFKDLTGRDRIVTTQLAGRNPAT